MRVSQIFTALVFGVFGSAAAAQSALVCDVRNTGGGGGWIASPIVFILDPEKKSARVLDPIILGTLEEAAPARLKVRAGGKVRVAWNVNNVRTVQHQVNISYNADVDTAKNSVVVRGSIAGASNRVRGSGTCRPLDASELRNVGNVLRG